MFLPAVALLRVRALPRETGFLVVEDAPIDGADPNPNADVGRVAGYVVADVIPNHNQPLGHVKDLAVHPDRRGDGLGRELLTRGLAVLAAQGARSVKLEVRRSNTAALSLYRDFGFEYLQTLPRYYGDGEDAFVFVTRVSRRGSGGRAGASLADGDE